MQTHKLWPTQPTESTDPEDSSELKKSALCAHVTASPAQINPVQHNTWADLVQDTYLSSHGAAAPPMSAAQRLETEIHLLKQAQLDSFPAEMHALKSGKEVRTDSRLVSRI